MPYEYLPPPNFLSQSPRSRRRWRLRPGGDSFVNLFQERLGIVDCRAPQHYSDTWCRRVDPGHHLGLLIRSTANDKHDDILRPITRGPTAIHERILLVPQLPLDKILERCLEQRRMLRVDVLDALEP